MTKNVCNNNGDDDDDNDVNTDYDDDSDVREYDDTVLTMILKC